MLDSQVAPPKIPATVTEPSLVMPSTPLVSFVNPTVGTGNGMAGADSAEYSPFPTPLIARTRNTYAVPLVKPVTAADVASPASIEVHEFPLKVLYSSSYRTIVELLARA